VIIQIQIVNLTENYLIKKNVIDYQSDSQKQIDGKTSQNFFEETGSTTDIRARNAAASDYKKLADMDNFASRHLDKSSLNKYEENRQYLEFHGNKFEVKPVTAYRINLGQFHETLKLVSKSIVVQRIDLIHAVPITDLRFLIKKALTQTMTLHDIGLFDNGILNYYRYYAIPIEQITISSLQSLQIGLHFPNIYIERMICDNQFDMTDARLICRIFLNSTLISSNIRFTTNIIHNQTNPIGRFKTNYVNEFVPCQFIISSLRQVKQLKNVNINDH
jgi:hypothetical protein